MELKLQKAIVIELFHCFSYCFFIPYFDAVQEPQQTHILHNKMIALQEAEWTLESHIPQECAGLFMLSGLLLSKVPANSFLF